MNPTTKTEPTHNPERESTRERILGVAAWLTSGMLRPEAVAGSMREWKVSRRTAQVYVQKAANRIARMTEYDDPLFAMKLSQLQRDKLFQQLQTLQLESVQMEPHEVRSFLQTIQAQIRLLDSRDRTAAKIAQLEAKLGRVEPRRSQASPEPLGTTEERPREPSPVTRPAPPESMRPAAQSPHQPVPTQQPKSQPDKRMRKVAAPATTPALRRENCALETGAVEDNHVGVVVAA